MLKNSSVTLNTQDTFLPTVSSELTSLHDLARLTFFYLQVAQMVKNLPAIREMWVQSLGWEDPLKKKWLPTPVFWPREFHGLNHPWGRKESDMTERLSLFHMF